MKKTSVPQKPRGSWGDIKPVTRVAKNKKKDVTGSRKRTNAMLRKYL